MSDNNVKVDIISGFLGAGKTTLIKKLLSEALKGENVVLIENEFGEIGVDNGFLKDAGIEIKEMNSGCICCTLVGDFAEALKEVIDTYHPDRIIIEPSGVGKLSDVIKSVNDLGVEGVHVNSASTVVDANKAKLYNKNFGEFFDNQIQSAGTVILSRTGLIDDSKVMDAAEIVNGLNEHARIITTDWKKLDGKKILSEMEGTSDLISVLMDEVAHPGRHYHDHGDGHYHYHEDEEHDHEHNHEHEHEHSHKHEHGDGETHEHEHHHHHTHDHKHTDGDESVHEHSHDNNELSDHEHHHDGHEHAHEHHHDHEHDHEHHHDHDHEHHHNHDHEHHHNHDHGHHHDHDHGESCGCGCGHDHDGHDHAADEVFGSWAVETPATIEKEALEEALSKLADETGYGTVLRAKGMLSDKDGNWMFFDMVPGEHEIREGTPETTGKIVVIGTELNEDKLKELFGV